MLARRHEQMIIYGQISLKSGDWGLPLLDGRTLMSPRSE
jgi:hypothetical protein